MTFLQAISDPENYPATLRTEDGGEIVIVNQSGWNVIRGIAAAAVAIHKKDENKRKNDAAKRA